MPRRRGKWTAQQRLRKVADGRATGAVENSELRARVEAREQRIRLLEEALRVLKANTYGPSRDRRSVAAGQVELFSAPIR